MISFKPNEPPKAPPPHTIALRLGLQNTNFGGTHFIHSRWEECVVYIGYALKFSSTNTKLILFRMKINTFCPDNSYLFSRFQFSCQFSRKPGLAAIVPYLSISVLSSVPFDFVRSLETITITFLVCGGAVSGIQQLFNNCSVKLICPL